MRRMGRIAQCLWASVVLFGGTALASGLIPPAQGWAPCENASLSTYLSSPGCSIGPFVLGNFGWAEPTGNASRLAQPDELDLAFDWFEPDYFLQVRLGGFDCLAVPGASPGCFDVGVEETATYQFRFTVDPAPIIESMDIAFDPPFGLLQGSVILCPGGIIGRTGCPFDTQTASFFFRNNESEPGVATFSPPLAVLDTDTAFTLNPNQNLASGLDGVIFRFHTTIPEPGSWMLMGTGLAAFAGLSRRRRR